MPPVRLCDAGDLHAGRTYGKLAQMWEDPIVEEVRRIRQEHAAALNHDLRKIYDDLKEQERQSGKAFVAFPPKRPTLRQP